MEERLGRDTGRRVETRRGRCDDEQKRGRVDEEEGGEPTTTSYGHAHPLMCPAGFICSQPGKLAQPTPLSHKCLGQIRDSREALRDKPPTNWQHMHYTLRGRDQAGVPGGRGPQTATPACIHKLQRDPDTGSSGVWQRGCATVDVPTHLNRLDRVFVGYLPGKQVGR